MKLNHANADDEDDSLNQFMQSKMMNIYLTKSLSDADENYGLELILMII